MMKHYLRGQVTAESKTIATINSNNSNSNTNNIITNNGIYIYTKDNSNNNKYLLNTPCQRLLKNFKVHECV